MGSCQAYAVGLYGASCATAIYASCQTAMIGKTVRSVHLKAIWKFVTILGMVTEALHASFTVYIGIVPQDPGIIVSATIMMFAAAIFAGMALLMRASVIDAQEVALLRQVAFRDALTEVGNRRAFDRDITVGMGRGPVAVILIDIDHFKAFNDTFGHDVGDEVLKHVAHLVSRAAAGNPTYRTGGEEFAIITSPTPAADLAETCRTLVEGTPLVQSGRRLSVTISVGIALSQEDKNAASVIRRADEALYRAKRSGRNQVAEAA